MKNIRKILVSLIFAMLFSVLVPNTITGQVINVQAATKINKSKVTLIKGQTTTLKITGTKKKIKWSSSKTSVATVTKKGKVTAKKTGTAKIIGKVGNKKYVCVVNVQTPKLNKSKVTITAGKKYTLKLSGTNQKIKWESSKKSIATVSSKGVVTAKKAGTVKITATVMKKKYTCNVTVKKKTTTSQNTNPQDAILSKITKKFTVGRYYGSNWKNALICTFKNNSGYDLCFNVHVTFDDGSATGTDGNNFFKNGDELVIVFDFCDFSKYKVEYTIKKTPDYIKQLYDKAIFSTNINKNRTVSYNCTNNIGAYNLEGIILYYNNSGSLIDYDRISWSTSQGYGIDGTFEPPVNQNLDMAPYSYYKTFYQIMQY